MEILVMKYSRKGSKIKYRVQPKSEDFKIKATELSFEIERRQVLKNTRLFNNTTDIFSYTNLSKNKPSKFMANFFLVKNKPNLCWLGTISVKNISKFSLNVFISRQNYLPIYASP